MNTYILNITLFPSTGRLASLEAVTTHVTIKAETLEEACAKAKEMFGRNRISSIEQIII